jgi:hypothetical protein
MRGFRLWRMGRRIKYSVVLVGKRDAGAGYIEGTCMNKLNGWRFI